MLLALNNNRGSVYSWRMKIEVPERWRLAVLKRYLCVYVIKQTNSIFTLSEFLFFFILAIHSLREKFFKFKF